MPTRLILAAMLCVLPGLGFAAALAPTIPDTPAGHVLASWLAAFNSGNVATFESFKTSHAPWLNTDGEIARRARTGGYDLLSINQSEWLWVTFRVKEKSSQVEVAGSLVVRSSDPNHVSLLSLAPAGTKPGQITVDGAERAGVIDGAARLIDEFYVFPDIARKVSAKLRKQLQRGDYRGITDGEVFAVRLDDDLQALSGDKHFQVDLYPEHVPDGAATRPGPHRDPQQLAASNCGFEAAEHYRPNIGYLKLTEITAPESCAPTAIAAMNFLADSDALVIDVRDVHGGWPPMVALICSYLFDEPTHLDDSYNRKDNSIEQLWTSAYVQGKKFIAKPVFVLTSGRTFSGGEELSFDLKNLHRATIVGETTGGGAHPVAPHRIDENFIIRVPFGRIMNPITKTDWEGTGVEPDVKVAALDALDEALRRARDQIASERSPR